MRARARAPEAPAAYAISGGGGGGGGGGAQEGGADKQAPPGTLGSPPGPDLEALGQAAVVDGVRLIAGGIEDMLQRLRVQARPPRAGRQMRSTREAALPPPTVTSLWHTHLAHVCARRWTSMRCSRILAHGGACARTQPSCLRPHCGPAARRAGAGLESGQQRPCLSGGRPRVCMR